LLSVAFPDPVHLHTGFLRADVAGALMQRCVEELDWHAETFSLFGRTHPVPRLISWVGDPGLDYRYAARSHVGCGWPAWLDGLRVLVGAATGQSFNHILVNRYRTGRDYMGWHRDDERGVSGNIAVLSLGAERRFGWREGPGYRSRQLLLPSGSILTLDGHWQHTLLRERQCEAERISLTFRSLFNVKNKSGRQGILAGTLA